MNIKRILLVLTLSWIFTSCGGSHSAAPIKETDCIMQPKDREIVEQILKQCVNDRDLKTGNLVTKAGKLLMDTPYVANTLEAGDSEKLVINLRELDCTTFAENCLALARTIKKKNPGFNDFARQLQLIRYRDGIRDGYPSRLHYFSDWIYNNDQKKIVESVSQKIGHTLIPNQVTFMSRHPESYPALQKNKDFVCKIAGQEAEISKRMTWFIPKNKLAEFESLIQDGDIIGITTIIDGLDVSHVVIALRVDGRLRFLHASSKAMKVVLSDQTLGEYLSNSRMASGIMVARPL